MGLYVLMLVTFQPETKAGMKQWPDGGQIGFKLFWIDCT
jgi:hypothetical protein